MINILITGANSYIGTSFTTMMLKYNDTYTIDTIDMIDGSWRKYDFSKYDCIFHVAGIAHIKETKENESLYYKINRDLAVETAKKAKAEGVKQFIILSSMSVYGIETGVINKQTSPNPKSNYGKSKLQADEFLTTLIGNDFSVAIVRPPMVYGKNCKGNYQTLSKYAVKLPIFPNIGNARSMIYIDNLTIYIKKLIDDKHCGLFFPQNAEYVNTSNLVERIALVHGKRIHLIRLFNPLIKILNINIINKVFGNLIYEKIDICDYVSYEDSIKASEA